MQRVEGIDWWQEESLSPILRDAPPPQGQGCDPGGSFVSKSLVVLSYWPQADGLIYAFYGFERVKEALNSSGRKFVPNQLAVSGPSLLLLSCSGYDLTGNEAPDHYF